MHLLSTGSTTTAVKRDCPSELPNRSYTRESTPVITKRSHLVDGVHTHPGIPQQTVEGKLLQARRPPRRYSSPACDISGRRQRRHEAVGSSESDHATVHVSSADIRTPSSNSSTNKDPCPSSASAKPGVSALPPQQVKNNRRASYGGDAEPSVPQTMGDGKRNESPTLYFHFDMII